MTGPECDYCGADLQHSIAITLPLGTGQATFCSESHMDRWRATKTRNTRPGPKPPVTCEIHLTSYVIDDECPTCEQEKDLIP